jgi:hypothetical protein
MKIERRTAVYGRPASLTFDPDFSTATVEPPAPFSGSAEFARAATGFIPSEGGNGTLLGDLSVEFPDRAKARLAGRRYSVEFISGSIEESEEH